MSVLFQRILPVALILSMWACQAPKKESKIQEKKPNIILIMADDQGWGDLSFNGNTNLKTPHIDAIAKNGVAFENFYVQPVCSPTRAELLTGRHFTRLGVYSTSAGGERLNLGETTIAEILKKAGYHTAAYGKWHNGMQPPYHPNARGFDDFYGFASGHWGNYFSPMLEHNGQIVKGNGFLVNDLTAHALSFIDENKDDPFFLYLPLNTPHSPMQVPDAYWDRFQDKPLDMTYHGEEKENTNFTKAALAMVENIDFNVGRISEKLRKLNLEENTIVVYLSDNGPNGWRWNGGMRGKKGSTDEGGVRAPFFIQWKDSIPAGNTVAQIAAAIDILPTLINLTGIEVETEKPIDGKNLSPLIFSKNTKWKERFVYNHWSGKTSVRSQRYRLDTDDRLYDMVDDIGQTSDVSDKFPDIADSLKKAKTNWLTAIPPSKKTDEERPLTLGHPDYMYTQIPARDGIPHGNIERSNRHPNDTFFTNWKNVNDSITWNVAVLADGVFEVQLYYTCKAENVGAALQLTHGNNQLTTTITEAHDPPLKGMENDRDPRIESYVKDFKPMTMGEIKLEKGKGQLTLKAVNISGKEAVDVRLLLFKRKE